MISILIITYGREEELFFTLKKFKNYKKEKIEILILDNNKNEILKKRIFEIFNNNEFITLKYYNDGINYGVALGRNYLIERASGDILITLDDDIDIEESIDIFFDKIKNYFLTNPQVGCLAFNIINYYSKKHLRHEIPHGNKKLDFDKNLLTYYYIGAGHAIRKEVYKEAGIYPEYLGKYGSEEKDLSFRILEKGFDILYTADIKIYHKVSPNGRLSKEQFYRYRNQLIVLNRYMPNPYRITGNIIWSVYFFIRNKINLKEIFIVMKDVKKIPKKTISDKTLNKIKQLKGRIWF